MAQVGRISGPLLQANLERQGKDLAFLNNESSTKLLYLDVNNNRVGINRDSATQTLDINGLGRISDLISSAGTLGNLEFRDSTIESPVGDILLNAADRISMSAIDNGTILIDDNNIQTTISNASLDLKPAVGGSVSVTNNLNVDSNIYTPGNIKIDGNIIFGNEQSQDTIQFNTEVNSNIIPDENQPSNLGSPTKRWRDLYTRLVNGEAIEAAQVDASGVDFTLRQGNIFYVDTNGDDANTGDHPQDPYRTLKRALDAADGSDLQPVKIFISAGEYEEQFPLEVPSYVSIVGSDVRNTIIKPAFGFEYKDAFLLDGDSTVQNITVKDFLYDDNTGYAFRFRPNAVIKERSPYIQNVTVITKGTETTQEDPRGFLSRDAGGGAYVDGAVLNSSSESASMLFNGCTFITPGADALVMTNGVRVEWLSCFTYFAYRGLYAFNNSTGRVVQSGETKFGAEMRSIASANVYGTYGAVADGDDCLLYLINHNFAYIGVDNRIDNDNTLAQEEQEVVEENSGRIVYTSIDHTGKYKVGDAFFVDFDSGITSLDVSTLTADAFTTIRLEDNGNQTIFDVNQLRTGNLVFTDNLLESLNGDINISSAVDINLNSNVDIEKNLTIRDDFSFGGSLNLLGNQATDTVTFEVDIEQDFLPDKNLAHRLGKSDKTWARVWLSQIHSDAVDIQNNFITTNQSNADLELRANSNGRVFIPENFLIQNNLKQTGSITLENTKLNNLDLKKDLKINKDFDLAGSLSLSENLTASEDLQFEKISIFGNRITTVNSNEDLELRANQTGVIRVPFADVILEKSISTGTLNTFSDIDIVNSVDFSEAQISNIFVDDNTFNTDNNDLVLAANGVGDVRLEDFRINENVLKTATENIILRPNQDIIIDSTGSIQLPVGDNEYTGIKSQIRLNNFDYVFEGFTDTARIGLGGVYSSDRQTSVLTDNLNQISFVTNDLFVGQVRSDALEVFKIDVDDVVIDANKIQTTVSNSDLELQTNQSAGTVIYNTRIIDNKIQNTSNGDLTFRSTDLGYYKIQSTGGVVFPYSIEANRPASAEIGDTRWNTTTELLEVWNGTEWKTAAGLEDTVSAAEFDELITEYTLIFG